MLKYSGELGRQLFGAAFALCLALIPVSALAQKQTVKVGFVGPLTGGTASIGLGARNSFLLAVQEHNAASKKYNFEPMVLDDECKPSVGVQAALKASSDPELVASVSHYCSVVAIATVDTWHRAGVPSMVWGAILPQITYGHKHVEITRVNGTMVKEDEVGPEWLVKTLGFKTFALIHDTTDYGREHAKYFAEGLQKVGGKILSTQGTAKDQTDYSAVLTRAALDKPEVIWFGGLTPDGVRVRVQMDRLGIKSQFVGVSGIKSDTFNETAGKIAEGAITFFPGAPPEKLPGGKNYLASYAKAGFKEPPEVYGAFAYAAANLVLDAIESVGPDRAKVAAKLKRTKVSNTVIGPVEFDEHGQNIVPLVSYFVSQDGKWVVWEDSEYVSGKRKLKSN